jgi:hypothetical protein
MGDEMRRCRSTKKHNVYGGNLCRCGRKQGHNGPHYCNWCGSEWRNNTRRQKVQGKTLMKVFFDVDVRQGGSW